MYFYRYLDRLNAVQLSLYTSTVCNIQYCIEPEKKIYKNLLTGNRVITAFVYSNINICQVSATVTMEIRCTGNTCAVVAIP